MIQLINKRTNIVIGNITYDSISGSTRSWSLKKLWKVRFNEFYEELGNKMISVSWTFHCAVVPTYKLQYKDLYEMLDSLGNQVIN